jgi:hypothetical protein
MNLALLRARLEKIIKRLIVWAIRKGLNLYPEETILPDNFHAHKNPVRRTKKVEIHTEWVALEDLRDRFRSEGS